MPIRATPLATGEFYHVYNRGVASQPTFLVKNEYQRFLLTLSYYRFLEPPVRLSKFLQLPKKERAALIKEAEEKNNKLIDIICFALMPNHFHLLVKQLTDNGVSTYLRRTTDSYVRYFNTKNERLGPLFQGVFKAGHISTDEQLIHVSRYIHLNPLVSFVVTEKNFLSYPWLSMQHFTNKHIELGMINPEPVLAHFRRPQDYLNFVLDQADYAKQLEKIKHLALE